MLEHRQIVVFEGKCRRFRLLANVQRLTARCTKISFTTYVFYTFGVLFWLAVCVLSLYKFSILPYPFIFLGHFWTYCILPFAVFSDDASNIKIQEIRKLLKDFKNAQVFVRI